MATNRNFIVKQGIQVGTSANVIGNFTSNTYNSNKYNITGNPSFVMDFLKSPVLDSRVTFFRSSKATYVNQQGIVTTAQVNTPRFEYDYATGEFLGLLLEPSVTNIIQSSFNYNVSTAWSYYGSAFTIPNTTIAPDGTNTASTLLQATDVTTGGQNLYQFATVVTNAYYTFSLWVKSAGATAIFLRIRDSLGGSSSSSFSLSNSWQRIHVSYLIPSSASSSGQFMIGGTDGDVYIWGAQAERGGRPTSYTPTDNATVVRASDYAYVAGDGFNSFYNQTAGSLIVSYSMPKDSVESTFNLIAGFSDGSFANSITIYERSIDDTNRLSYRSNNIVSFDITNSTAYTYNNNTSKVILTYGAGSYSLSVASSTTVTGTAAILPTMTMLGIGTNFHTGGSLDPINGHIKRITYYPRQLSSNELTSLIS